MQHHHYSNKDNPFLANNSTFRNTLIWGYCLLLQLSLQNELAYTVYSFFTEHSLRNDSIDGLVGPNSNAVAERVAYIFGEKQPTIMVC